jgi:hypothetical protein
MAMEASGGNLPPGRAVAVLAAGKTHVFAIAAGGTKPLGLIGWHRLAGPADLLRGPTNLEPSFPRSLVDGATVNKRPRRAAGRAGGRVRRPVQQANHRPPQHAQQGDVQSDAGRWHP